MEERIQGFKDPSSFVDTHLRRQWDQICKLNVLEESPGCSNVVGVKINIGKTKPLNCYDHKTPVSHV